MNQIPEPGQVWFLELDELESYVLVLEPILYEWGLGYPGWSLLDGRRIVLFMQVGGSLPDSWKRLA